MTTMVRRTPEEIAASFAAERAANKAEVARRDSQPSQTSTRNLRRQANRRARNRDRRASRQEARQYLATQETPEVKGSLADQLRGLGSMRGPDGRYLKTRSL
jgi:hypothetical protein